MMSALPNAARAVVDIRKIRDYCLDASHPRGRHKARVFRQALGFERSDAAWLRDALLAAVVECNAIEDTADRFGTRWRVDVPNIATREKRRDRNYLVAGA